MNKTLGSLSNDVFERRKSAGSGLLSFLDDGFAKIFSQIALVRVKKLSNTNLYRQSILRGKRPHFRLTCVAQKRFCLSSLLSNHETRTAPHMRLTELT